MIWKINISKSKGAELNEKQRNTVPKGQRPLLFPSRSCMGGGT